MDSWLNGQFSYKQAENRADMAVSCLEDVRNKR